jgi:hypothetical protein
MYKVASSAFTAGVLGKRTAKIFDVKLVVSGRVARLCSLSDSTSGQLCGKLAYVENTTSLYSIPAIAPRSG